MRRLVAAWHLSVSVLKKWYLKIFTRQLSPSTSAKLVYATELFFCLIVIAARHPDFIFRPRMWAEEGGVYFSAAYLHPSIVTFLRPELGYYSFFNKIAVTGAVLVPLTYAACVTLVFSLIAQLFLFDSILRANRKIYTPVVKLALVIGALSLPTLEIWLNTISSQYWLAASAILLLSDVPSSRISKAVNLLKIFLFAATGPFVLIIGWVFLLKFSRTPRTTYSRAVVAIVGLWLVLQTLAVLGIWKSGVLPTMSAQGAVRFSEFSLRNTIAGIEAFYISYPFEGHFLYEKNRIFFHLIAVAIAVGLAGVFAVRRNDPFYQEQFVLISLVTVGTIVGSLGGMGGLRYAFVENLMLVACVTKFVEQKHRTLALFIPATLICVYFADREERETSFHDPHWTDWAEEVKGKDLCSEPVWVWPQRSGSDTWKVSLARECQ